MPRARPPHPQLATGSSAMRRRFQAPNRKAVRAKIVAAAPSGSVSGLEGAIENALRKAHDFSSDIMAWSAVFVGSCVRAAAIKLKLEGVLAGRHEGKDGLLAMSFRHTEYIAAARGRKKGKQGAYLAFQPKGRVIKKGGHHPHRSRGRNHDGDPHHVASSRGTAQFLHCDIVCGAQNRWPQPDAETIGGNVTHTVRRRRYPLTATGELMVSPRTTSISRRTIPGSSARSARCRRRRRSSSRGGPAGFSSS